MHDRKGSNERLEAAENATLQTPRIYCPLSMDEEQPKPRLFTSKFSKSEMELMQTEKSRSVKIFFLKFKCIVVFTVIFVAFLEFLYICLKEFMGNEEIIDRFFNLVNIFINKTNSPEWRNFSDIQQIFSNESIENADLNLTTNGQ